jgi:hypothetical protein
MTNFDELPLEEKIKMINELGVKLGEAAMPIVKHLEKVFLDFGRAMSLVVGEIEKNLPDEFIRIYLREAKKERHRKRYNRMMARHKSPYTACKRRRRMR